MPPDHEPSPAGPAPSDAAPATPRPPDGAREAPPIVDFARAAHRIRLSATVLGAAALVAWVVVGLLTGGPDPADLGGWAALVLAGMFLVEVVVVGGSALRGMLRAGDRGERLAGGDVGLLPPQLTGRSPRRLQDQEPDR